MDFSAQLDDLQQHAAQATSAAQAAASEPHDQLKQRVDQAHGDIDIDTAAQDAQQQARAATASAPSTWAQTKADAAAKRDDVKAKLDKRARQMDAGSAAGDADWAATDAAAAIEFAVWADATGALGLAGGVVDLPIWSMWMNGSSVRRSTPAKARELPRRGGFSYVLKSLSGIAALATDHRGTGQRTEVSLWDSGHEVSRMRVRARAAGRATALFVFLGAHRTSRSGGRGYVPEPVVPRELHGRRRGVPKRGVLHNGAKGTPVRR